MTRAHRIAVLALVLLPLVWLWPHVFGDRRFVPYDLGQFPPASLTASDAELDAARAGANLDVTEVPTWFVPELRFAGEEIAKGRLPTWDPHARTGAPLHAHGLVGLGYPPNWLALFAADPEARLGLVAWLNLAIGGLLAFGLFRHLGIALLPAWLGAALFELSGPMAANAFFWMRLGSFVWLPGVVWAMSCVAARERAAPRALFALALCFAMPWLSGFPPFAATTTVFAGGVFAWLVVERLRARGAREALRLATTLAAGLLLGACLAAPQVLPSLAFFPESARPPVPLWRDVAGQAFEPYGLLGYVMPDAFGHPTTLATLPYVQGPAQLLWNTRTFDGRPALPNYNWTEYTVFVSTLGIVLAALGLTVARGQRAWLARAALALALGLGLFWPGLQLLFHLPVVQNVWPMRWPAAGTLFVAWLAAAGAEGLLASARRPPLVLAVSCFGAALALWQTTAAPLRRHAADPTTTVAALAEHYRCTNDEVVNHVQGVPPVPFDRFDAGFERLAAAGRTGAWWLVATGAALLAFAFVTGRARNVVLLATGGGALLQLALAGSPALRGAVRTIPLDSEVHAFLRERADALAASGGFTIARAAPMSGLPDQLPPGVLMHRGIRDLNFYSHADARTLVPVRRLADAWAKLRDLPEGTGEILAGKGYLTQSLPAELLQHPLFDLLGLRYVLATERLDAVGPRVGPELRSPRGELFVHERPRALPRAFSVAALVPLDDDEQVLAWLADPSRSGAASRRAPPARAVRDELPAGFDASGSEGADEPRAVAFALDEATHIELDVAAGSDPFLVLADTFLPGWTATVDGRETPIVRANHSQRLVRLPATSCRVAFRYAAPGLAAGLWLSAFATVVFLVWWIATVRRSRH